MRARTRTARGSTPSRGRGGASEVAYANNYRGWGQPAPALFIFAVVIGILTIILNAHIYNPFIAYTHSNDHSRALEIGSSLGQRPGRSVQELVRTFHIQSLWDTGHVSLRELLQPAEVLVLAPIIESIGMEIVDRCAHCDSPNDITDTVCRGCDRTRATPHLEKSFHKARNLHRVSSVCAAVANSKYLQAIAARLLNVSRVQLYHDAVFIKESGDKESGWHQDSAAAPLDTDKVVTIWIALNNVARSEGPLIFAEGSHRNSENRSTPSLRQVPLSERVMNMRHYTDEEVARHYKITATRSLAAGDATAHLGWTLHRAPPNGGDTARKAYAVTYFADGAKVHADLIAGMTTQTRNARGIRFAAGDGVGVTVQLLSDDISTWVPWMMSGLLTPGQPLNVPSTADTFPL